MAAAQLSATLQEKKNVVKYSRNNLQFQDAPVQQALGRGDYVVTGARSMAGVLYSDNSYFRVNESSKVQITVGTRQRDISLPDKNSAVYGKLNGPGRVLGQRALCAVRGTEIEVLVLNDRDVIRCFGPQGHKALVTSKDNSLVTGRVTTAGAAQVASTDLIGNTENWVGGRLQFIGGTGQQQTRTVTGFDPASGSITLNAPLPDANNLDAWFYVVNPPNARLVVLDKNMETSISHVPGAEPVDPYATEPKEFAGGDALAFMNEKLQGNNQSHLTGFFNDRTRQSFYRLDNARNTSQGYSNEAPGIQALSGSFFGGHRPPGGGTGGGTDGGTTGGGGGGSTGGGGGSTGGGGTGTVTGNLGVGVGSPTGPGTGNIGVGIGNGATNGNGGLVVQVGPSRAIFPRVPQFGAIGYATTGSDSAFAYATDSAVLGSVYMRVGGRIGTLERGTDNQLDELLLRYRNRHVGDIQVGRFHWLPGPVSNAQIGRLISFTSSEGVLWDLPVPGNLGLQVAWFDKINPLSRPNVSGYSARVTVPVRVGQVAFTALATSQRTVGGTMDFVYPILPQNLEIYGEAGVDTAHQTVYAAGLYFPQLFHKFKADFSIELSYRGQFGHSVDMALHLPVSRYATGLVTLSKPGSRGWRPGVGLQLQF